MFCLDRRWCGRSLCGNIFFLEQVTLIENDDGSFVFFFLQQEICADFAAMSGYEAGQGGGTVPLGSGGSEGSKLPCCK